MYTPLVSIVCMYLLNCRVIWAQFLDMESNIDQLVNEVSKVFLQEADESRYILIVVERLGLANRLRYMADWYVVAQLCNRKLLVTWAISLDCNIAFSSLFSSIPADMTVISYTSTINMEELVVEAMQQNSISYVNLTSNALYWKGEGDFLLSPLVLAISEQIIYMNFIGRAMLDSYPCQYYMLKRSAFYANLQPLPSAVDFVNHLINTYFATSMPIGVHVRSHDPVFDWAVVAPTGGDTRAVEFGQGATVEDFTKLMEEINTNLRVMGEHNNISSPLVRFLVVSNDQSIKDELQTRFGGQAVSLQGELRRYTEEGMYFAFLEFLALSRMSLIIHTHGSSFAQEAAHVHQVPLVGLWGGLAVHTDHVRLPHCGNLQVLRAYAKPIAVDAYVEGTIDERTVISKTFSLTPSNELNYIGLKSTYIIME